MQIKKTKEMMFLKCPRYLIILLKRCENNDIFKSNTYTCGDKNKGNKLEYPLKDFEVPYDDGNGVQKEKYDLYAVIHHEGILGGGHYWAT